MNRRSLLVPALMVLFRPKYSQAWLLLLALRCYVLSKIAEAYYQEVFASTQNLVNGHTLKHLLAACAGFSLPAMLKARSPLDD